MKKLLSLLLALIMCLGVFISCGDETESSNESSSSSESSSESSAPELPTFFNNSALKVEDFATYYKSAGDFTYIGDKVSRSDTGTQYHIINSYDEFKAVVSDYEKLDASVFEDNFLFISKIGVKVGAETIGFHQLKLQEDGCPHIIVDVEQVGEIKIVDGIIINQSIKFILIPREEFDISKVEASGRHGREMRLILFHDYTSINSSELELNDGATWVINSEDALNTFKTTTGVYLSDKITNLSDSLYVVVYREKSNKYTDVGYGDCVFSNSTGNLSIRSYRRLTDVDNEQISYGFDIIRLGRSYVTEVGVSETTKAEITAYNIYTK